MLWLSLRQFRAQMLTGLAIAVTGSGLLLYLGLNLRSQHRSVLDHCTPLERCPAELAQFAAEQHNTLLFLAGALYLVPFLVGMFWGAPLVATELEHGTHRFVWNQGVTRTRWLLGRLIVPAVCTAVLAGALTAAMTWAAAPVDRIADDKFGAILFGARDLAPVGHAMFALALGTLTGSLIRRRLPAMVICAGALLAVQIAVPNFVRPHIIAPETVSRPMTVEAINAARSMGSITGAPRLGGLEVKDAWVSDTSDLLTRTGAPLSSADFDRCYSHAPDTGAQGRFGDIAVCLAKMDLHVDLQYQPNSRYWTFQVVELAGYLLAAGLATAAATWLIRRRVT